MDYFQHGEGLGPFCEGADAAVDVVGADEGDEEEHAAEDGGPEDGAHEVVADEVVLFLLGVGASVGGVAGVHRCGLRCGERREGRWLVIQEFFKKWRGEFQVA